MSEGLRISCINFNWAWLSRLNKKECYDWLAMSALGAGLGSCECMLCVMYLLFILCMYPLRQKEGPWVTCYLRRIGEFDGGTQWSTSVSPGKVRQRKLSLPSSLGWLWTKGRGAWGIKGECVLIFLYPGLGPGLFTKDKNRQESWGRQRGTDHGIHSGMKVWGQQESLKWVMVLQREQASGKEMVLPVTMPRDCPKSEHAGINTNGENQVDLSSEQIPGAPGCTRYALGCRRPLAGA